MGKQIKQDVLEKVLFDQAMEKELTGKQEEEGATYPGLGSESSPGSPS